MVKSETLRAGDMDGIRFIHEDKEYEILFNTADSSGGKISITKNGQKLLEKNFSEEVKGRKSQL